MNTSKLIVALLTASSSFVFAQDIESAKKAIDAEQFQKAKTILKSLTASKSDQGRPFFLLGNIYLTQKVNDSAILCYNKGLSASNEGFVNYVGLGQIEMEKGDVAAAKSNFDKATSAMKKKDHETLLDIARACMNKVKPDYKTALAYVNKAVALKPQDGQVQLALGDASYGDNNVNAAYSAYRDAYDYDNSLLRAKLRLAVITKRTKAFDQAKNMFNDITKINANYGPAYRELAETYYLWALNDSKNYESYNKLAIQNYEKYMSLTDYSLDSRMRRADFMILTKDYKGLEAEANAMQKLDKVNPRILRYLGFSAFKNGNPSTAITALTEFLSKEKKYTLGLDYLYLGLSKLSKSIVSTTNPDKSVTNKVDRVLFDSGVLDVKKGLEMDKTIGDELSEYAKKMYSAKSYKEAAELYEINASNAQSPNFFYDNYYLGSSYYYMNNKEGVKINTADLNKGLKAFDNVIKDSPKTQDGYLFKARIHALLGEDAVNAAEMAKYYQEYINVLDTKDQAEKDKPNNKTKAIEALNNLAVFYLKSDKTKAKGFLDRVLLLDPSDANATANMKFVK
jgi:lipopolysaccharide biosynthesis regulator YciM